MSNSSHQNGVENVKCGGIGHGTKFRSMPRRELNDGKRIFLTAAGVVDIKLSRLELIIHCFPYVECYSSMLTHPKYNFPTSTNLLSSRSTASGRHCLKYDRSFCDHKVDAELCNQNILFLSYTFGSGQCQKKR